MTDTTPQDDESTVEPETVQDAPESPVEGTEEPETYPAEHVKDLRHEIGKYRQKARRVDDANARLVAAYARADGRLIDATALEYTDDLLDDDGLVDDAKVAAAISALVESKPYLHTRRPTSSIPQGPRADVTEAPSLLALMRSRT